MSKYRCSICGHIYDEAKGDPESGIPPGTKWEDVPENWVCPLCGASKSAFVLIKEKTPAPAAAPAPDVEEHTDDLRELTAGEISAICSNLAKGCEKQRLDAETEAFYKIADYFRVKAASERGKTLKDAADMLNEDLAKRFSAANAAANAAGDRGALRSLVWGERVSLMMKSLLERFAEEGDAMLADTKIWVCDICGFIYVGDIPPEVCPVCKVPRNKIKQIERR